MKLHFKKGIFLVGMKPHATGNYCLGTAKNENVFIVVLLSEKATSYSLFLREACFYNY